MGAELLVRVPALLVFPVFALPWNLPLIFCSGEDETADENPESQEMLEEQLVRMLTREVMDLISKWHVGARGGREEFFWRKNWSLTQPHEGMFAAMLID